MVICITSDHGRAKKALTFCPRCGKWFETNFCPKCGEDLRAFRHARPTGNIGLGVLVGSLLLIFLAWIPWIGLIFAMIAGMVAGLMARGAGRGALAGFAAGIIGVVVASVVFAPLVTSLTGMGWISYVSGLILILSLFGGLIGGAARPRTPKQSGRTELTSGPEFSARRATETKAPRECRICHNTNPPYAMNYCIKCGAKLD